VPVADAKAVLVVTFDCLEVRVEHSVKSGHPRAPTAARHQPEGWPRSHPARRETRMSVDGGGRTLRREMTFPVQVLRRADPLGVGSLL